jgi:antitoxin component of MazEF toxin-antitoxin module
MAISRGLRRLLRVRNLEEEQSRQALESALGELNRLESALTAAAGRERGGRRLIASSARAGQLQDRIAGLEETRSASRQAETLEPRIKAKGEEVTELRQAFVLKRVERRQAETLIQEMEARDAVEAVRRGQQRLDDWYSSRLRAKRSETDPRAPAAEQSGSQPDAHE